jgi:hypothetical protein
MISGFPTIAATCEPLEHTILGRVRHVRGPYEPPGSVQVSPRGTFVVQDALMFTFYAVWPLALLVVVARQAMEAT